MFLLRHPYQHLKCRRLKSRSVEGVDKLFLVLSPIKASGLDEIFPRILGELHLIITLILTEIFRLSMFHQTGEVQL